MTTFDVYSRQGCHLCEVLIEELLPLVRGRAEVRVVDIDSDPDLRAKYDILVPILASGDREICRYKLDQDAVLAALAEADESA